MSFTHFFYLNISLATNSE